MNVKLRRFLIEAKRLLGDQLWELPVENFSKAKRNLVRFIKLTRITFNEFAVNRMGFQCVALSYFVVLSIVPFVAFVFAVGDGLGYHEKIASLLYTAMPHIKSKFLTAAAGCKLYTAIKDFRPPDNSPSRQHLNAYNYTLPF